MSRSRGRLRVDEKDKAIVEMLMRDARTSFREMARVLGMSDVAVRKRVLKLEREGVILGYTALVDPGAAGYVASLTGVDVEPGALLSVARELAQRDYVRAAWITTGDHEIMLEIWARDEAEMDQIIREIRELPGVVRVCPAVITGVLKPRRLRSREK